jgi:hypothetical protein
VTSDAQAALAAATEIMAERQLALPAHAIGQITLNMADGFLRWLQQRRAAPDERLVPNEDFRSPSAARTERIDPRAVLNASGPTMPLRTVERHMLDPIQRTPSGAYACLCGEKWPCSQREGAP